MIRRALIVWGGWEGHEPEPVARLFEELLVGEGFQVEVTNSLARFEDDDDLQRLGLIVPIVTMSRIEPAQTQGVSRAVAEFGVGLAGCHGGMCDSFREDTDWQFMTGGQWVAHPGNDNVRYRIRIDRDQPHEITKSIEDFDVVSEQYYLHVDPGNAVLAYTEFPHPDHPGLHSGNPCKMPQVWTRNWGRGRVFYSALGHSRAVLEEPSPKELMRRGFLWATRRDDGT